MDVDELLSFKPATVPKRSLADPASRTRNESDHEEDSFAFSRDRKKKARLTQQSDDDRMAQLEKEAALALAASKSAGNTDEDGQEVEDDTFSDNKLKRLILQFEKASSKNQMLRIKFPEEPTRFMTSELELHDAIQELRVVSTAPDLYVVLMESGCIPLLMGLLSHENTDIAVAVIDLLHDLTDADTLLETSEAAESLIRCLRDNQFCSMLVQNLERLNDAVREESDGIHNSLSIVENLIEFDAGVCKEAADAGLLAWLIKKLKVKVPFDSNKLYAAEILSILLQSQPDIQQAFGEIAGSMDSILQQLAYYKRHNPSCDEEQELMENLFDCLCSLLLCSANRELFLKGEGLQLMNLMLREKKESRSGALKVLDHALIGPDGRECCHKFVDILGLRTIFPLFMKTPKRNKRKGVSVEEYEEHVISVLASLLKNCLGTQRQRVLAKFTEADHEKVERLMELHFKYLDRVQSTESELLAEDEDGARSEHEGYLKRLAGGLFTLQLIDYIIVDTCATGSSSVKQRVHKILRQRKASVKTIRNVMREYAGNLGDQDLDEPEESRELERQHILQLVDKF